MPIHRMAFIEPVKKAEAVSHPQASALLRLAIVVAGLGLIMLAALHAG